MKIIKMKRFWIVEGAGGILVPLNENELMIDLIKVLNLPVIIVARSGLGTINHTLLTIETLAKSRFRNFRHSYERRAECGK